MRAGRMLVRAAVMACVASACGCAPPRTPQPFAQSTQYAYVAEWSPRGVRSSGRLSLDSLSHGEPGHWGLPFTRLRWIGTRARLHPDLLPLLASDPRDTTGLELVVAFRDTLHIRRLPIERFSQGDDSLARLAARDSTDSLRARLLRSRDLAYVPLEAWLRRYTNARVQGRFALTLAVVARVPRGRLRRLAEWNQVVAIRPLRVVTRPPHADSSVPPNSIAGAAAWMGLDHLADAGLARGSVRVMDSGVDASHPWFEGLARAEGSGDQPALVLHDCVAAGDCPESAGGDLASLGHGTGVASILVSRALKPNRGVTQARLHECQVNWRDADGVLLHDASAIEAALFAPLASPPDVALVEIQDREGPDGVIAASCDGAFEQGVCVIAPIGNGGAWDGVDLGKGAQSPGSARGVIGIGARESALPSQDFAEQCYGHVRDRDKPDLQALTNVSAAFPGDHVYPMSATSGAAPFAAAAALELRMLFADASQVVDPGQVYAALIACGESLRDAGGEFPEVRGAGLLGLPSEGTVWFGATSLSDNGWREIVLLVPDPKARRLRVGLWWKDPAPTPVGCGFVSELHRDFDLEVRDADEVTLAVSQGTRGVFERIDVPIPAVTSGAARLVRLRIQAHHVGSAGTPAYWSAFATP